MKGKRARARVASAGGVGGVSSAPQPAAASVGWGGFGSGYTAADQSQDRGYVYFPTLEAEKELKRSTREEIARKAKWLVRNDGISKKLQRGIVAFVGSQRPQPSTTDAQWNREAQEAFEEVASSPMIHDVTGREDFYERQKSIIAGAIEMGDAFVVLTKTASGNPSTAFYEGSQVFTPPKGGDNWRDGVRVDPQGRPLAYGFKDGDGVSAIDARDVIHFGLFPSPRAPRGVSIFAHAANRLLDIREVDNDTLRGIKAANLVGFYVTGPQAGPEKLALQGGFTNAKNPLAQSGNGQPEEVQFERIWSGGGNMARLDNGREIKAIHDDRRHPNQQSMVDHIIKSVAWGTDFPYEALYAISGLTGPAVRAVLRQTEAVAKEWRKQMRVTFCQRFYVYAISRLMKEGRLRQCNDSRWWKCDWIGREALTIDAGREWGAEIAAMKMGANTLRDWYAEASQDVETKLRDRAVELALAMKLEKEHGLLPGTLIQNEVIMAANAANASAQPPMPTQ